MNDIMTWLKNTYLQLQIPQGNPKDILLEPGLIVSCQECEKEHGINQLAIKQLSGCTISHKTCIRHIPKILSLYTGKKPGQPVYDEMVQKHVNQSISRSTQNKWQGEPRDLSRPENQLILNWFKNPTPL